METLKTLAAWVVAITLALGLLTFWVIGSRESAEPRYAYDVGDTRDYEREEAADYADDMRARLAADDHIRAVVNDEMHRQEAWERRP